MAVDNSDRLLSPLQQRFVEEYVKDSTSATAAAKRAGYSIHSATEVASRLLADPRVKKQIQEANDYAIKSLGITKERVLQEIAVIAFANPQTLLSMDEKGELTIDLHRVKSDKSGATEVTVSHVLSGKNKGKTINIKSVKLADKVAALDKLGKVLGIWKDSIEVNNKFNLLDLIQGSYKELPQPDYVQIESTPVETVEEEPLEEEPIEPTYSGS